MKKITLAAFAILVLTTMSALAVAPTASTSVSVTVAAAASIAVPATTTLTYGGVFPTGTYSGSTTITFSCRTTKVGGTGNIALQATAATWTATAGGTGPVLADITYGSSAGTYAGVGSYQAAATAVQNGVNSNVLSGLGANNHTNAKTVLTNFTMNESATWETDTYTLPIQFTLTSL